MQGWQIGGMMLIRQSRDTRSNANNVVKSRHQFLGRFSLWKRILETAVDCCDIRRMKGSYPVMYVARLTLSDYHDTPTPFHMIKKGTYHFLYFDILTLKTQLRKFLIKRFLNLIAISLFINNTENTQLHRNIGHGRPTIKHQINVRNRLDAFHFSIAMHFQLSRQLVPFYGTVSKDCNHVSIHSEILAPWWSSMSHQLFRK